MMSKKKWILLLIIFVIYLLLGASFFYKIESEHEEEKRNESRRERIEILKLLELYYNPDGQDTHEDFLNKLGTYCGKNLINVSEEHYDEPPKWDFYHSVFFSFTVVTTVGYGNLAPTVTVSRIFMIFYGLIGIPYNGILFATLGEYFGRTFIKLYKRWKTSNGKVKEFGHLGLVGQVVLYLIPGFTIFIFLPAVLFMIFEDWEYDLAVYYAFVTLTTIGFGDYVAGMNRYNHGFGIYFFIYQIFLLVWITFGLGYLVMVLGFITRGLRSKRMAQLEKNLKINLKTTHAKIWGGFTKDITYLRRLMNELYMAKFQPVYRDDFTSLSTPKIGSQSFPDLRTLRGDMSPKTMRRRAFSECLSRPLTRAQSDSDLGRIDKDATFAMASAVQPCELLAKVVDALGSFPAETGDDSDNEEMDLGMQGFSDSVILKSEMFGSRWSISDERFSKPPKVPRTRATSEIKIPERVRQDGAVEWTWSGPAATQKLQELRERTKFTRPRVRSQTESSHSSGRSWLDKFRSSFRKRAKEASEDKKQTEMDKQQYLENTAQGRNSAYTFGEEKYLNKTKTGRHSVFSVPESRVLEETTVADLLRALTSLHSRVGSIPEIIPEPRRKLGTASLTPPKITSMVDLFSPPPQSRVHMRRASMTPNINTRRRFSLHPVKEGELPPPPPYSEPGAGFQGRRGSLIPPSSSATSGLVHKQISRLKGPQGSDMPYRRTRHDSLRDIRIEKP